MGWQPEKIDPNPLESKIPDDLLKTPSTPPREPITAQQILKVALIVIWLLTVVFSVIGAAALLAGIIGGIWADSEFTGKVAKSGGVVLTAGVVLGFLAAMLQLLEDHNY